MSADTTQAYCMALLNQEKSLDELQHHLKTTEDLFRESVKRKNGQLDLLQAEVRRLKASIAGRGEQTAGHAEAAISAHSIEVQKLRETLKQRDVELDGFVRQVTQLKEELQDERRKSTLRDTAEETSQVRSELIERREELDKLRAELAAAESAASQLQRTSAEAEKLLEMKDEELVSSARYLG